ncbi:MAG: carboxypeptidase-like regulatory domain-containing protein [Ignavibacteriales bacterium]|nr:carboxypeptidase-like regulatory domain-containing protein [Ignavibacteriales bacterium]
MNPVDSATVYFFYSGIYLLDTAKTSSSGNYRITLPEGDYTIGVEKEGYYVVFHDSTYDPFLRSVG